MYRRGGFKLRRGMEKSRGSRRFRAPTTTPLPRRTIIRRFSPTAPRERRTIVRGSFWSR
jgi:hypothetical protein